MSLASYAAACRGFMDELKASLSDEDIESLRKECALAGLDGWLDWCGENSGHIADYVTATPSKRRSRKAWSEPAIRRTLTLAAMQYVQRSRILLAALSTRPLPIGISYRDMAVEAGELYVEICGQEPDYWPFADPNPFLPAEKEA